MIADRNETPRSNSSDAVGIVVQNRQLAQSRPRAIAFVWGREIDAAPSLPFGRWKKEVRPAV